MIANTIIILGIAALLLSMITAIARQGRSALSGTPPIPLWALLTGKTAIAISIFIMLFRALGLPIGPDVPWAVQAVAVGLLLAGLSIAVPSLYQLGEELRFGLSQEQEAALKSNGWYRISRNPLYLGFYLIGAASCLYVPVWFNLALVLLAISIHHQIVRSEERFLRQRFGPTYDEYARHVRRYL
jgi:protein-S-isoprenylcysteine O-methyltransferase Ste14